MQSFQQFIDQIFQQYLQIEGSCSQVFQDLLCSELMVDEILNPGHIHGIQKENLIAIELFFSVKQDCSVIRNILLSRPGINATGQCSCNLHMVIERYIA